MMDQLKKNVIDLAYIQRTIPQRENNAYKNNFGHIFIIGGNKEMGGAVQMAGSASVYSGAGLTTVATHTINTPAIHSVLPEAMVCDLYDNDKVTQSFSKANVVLIGPGLGLDSQDQWNLFKQLVMESERSLKIIIDGDGLSYVSQELAQESEFTSFIKKENSSFILTPHRGEWARLTNGMVDPDNLSAVQNWVNAHRVTLVLKSAPTRIFTPDTLIYQENIYGNPGMATGGMGDTLAGMIAGFLGQKPEVLDAVNLATSLHSYIADQLYNEQYIVLPTRITHAIPATLKTIQTMNNLN